ncbi:MAG: hypothetical protein AAGB00_04945 [Planctomycetota bacterium]
MTARYPLALLILSSAIALPVATAQPTGQSVVVEVEGPTLVAPPAPTVVPAPVGVYSPAVHAAPAVECCPIEVLREHATLSAKHAYRCYGGPMTQVLCVDNPADCCQKFFAVPVCVPKCCVDEPTCVTSTVGLLGRGIVVYKWACGFEAVVTFRVHGGVLITYR